MQLEERINHAKYGLRPEHRFNAQHPMVNDELPNRIICGSIIIKPNIRKITKTGVEFEDGTVAEDIDVIIYATGYVFGFPFIDKSVIEVVNNKVRKTFFMLPSMLYNNHHWQSVLSVFSIMYIFNIY